jgi:glycosyltransferase involved in cell wall biosynthesis
MENTPTVTLDQKYRYVFTVFTPSYNRAHTLGRVYESLKKQTFRDFEWLIVDDGSTDNTREIVEQWQQENIFPIRYIYQENGHKHIAFGHGVREADGELFLTLDSDDSCEPEALERFKYHWDTIHPSQQINFSAVTCLCKSIDGKIIGDLFPTNPTDSNSLEMRYKFKIKGEKWGFHRTEVLRGISFYEQMKGSHVPESVFWNQIAVKYQTRFVNEALRIYQDDQESIMRNVDNPSKSALGLHLQYLNVLNQEMAWFRFDPLQLIRSAIHYSRFSFHLGNNIDQQIGDLQTFSGKVLCSLVLPLGYLVYRKDQ